MSSVLTEYKNLFSFDISCSISRIKSRSKEKAPILSHPILRTPMIFLQGYEVTIFSRLLSEERSWCFFLSFLLPSTPPSLLQEPRWHWSSSIRTRQNWRISWESSALPIRSPQAPSSSRSSTWSLRLRTAMFLPRNMHLVGTSSTSFLHRSADHMDLLVL